MKKSKLPLKITLAILFCTALSAAHAQNFEWAKAIGGNGGQEGRSITVDASGNVYTTGRFQGTADFDPGTGTANLTSAGNYDVFVQKLDASGNLVWARRFGGIFEDRGLSISVDALGNVYTTGFFRGTVDFDPGAGTANLTSAGETDVFVQKLSPSGNFLWAKRFGGIFLDQGFSNAVDLLGNVYTTGVFRGTVDFDTGPGTTTISSQFNDVFIQKLDASGNFLWAKAFGGLNDDQGLSITVDSLGNIYTSGYFSGTADFDPGIGITNLTSSGAEDIFIQKLDSSGNFLWAKSFGGTSNDRGLSISVDLFGNVFTTGYFQGTVDFDPGIGTINLTSSGAADIFVQKLNASGNFLWAKTFGGVTNDRGLSLVLDTSGNVYTTGFFRGTVDFDPGIGTTNLTASGSENMFIQKLTGSGNFLWARGIGAGGVAGGNAITIDGLGNLYTTGYFVGNVDFNTGTGIVNLTSVGSFDAFVHKMSPCTPNITTINLSACDFYVWQLNATTYTTSGLYTEKFFNVAGCDSIVNLNLTVKNSSQTFQSVTACSSYTWPVNSNTYTKTGSYSSTFTNSDGCDSIVTLNLTINKVSDISTSFSTFPGGVLITANNAAASYKWLDCDNNYAVIAGETGQTFATTINGNYAVELIENDCADTSDCVSVIVGILENTFNQAIKIFPNPTSGTFTIDLGDVNESIKVNINDALGRLVYSENFTTTSLLKISLDQPTGVYFIELQSGEKTAKLKLITE